MLELKLLPGILYTLLSSRLANLCSLCSGVSSAVPLAHRSLSSSLRLPTSAFFVFLLDPSFELLSYKPHTSLQGCMVGACA